MTPSGCEAAGARSGNLSHLSGGGGVDGFVVEPGVGASGSDLIPVRLDDSTHQAIVRLPGRAAARALQHQ